MNPILRRLREGGWLLGILAMGLAVRLSHWATIFRGGRVFFVDTDDFYHLRRIMTAAANFPFLPTYDPYLGFPEGFHCNFPPLYDLFVGFLTLVAGLGMPSLRTAQLVAAFVPPLAGTAALYLFWRVGSAVLSRRAALIALALAAVFPMPVFYTLLGRPDHHCFEAVWWLAALLCVLKMLEADESGERSFDYPAWAAGAGAALALGVLFWIGSVVFSLVLFLYAAHEILLGGGRGPRLTAGLMWFPLVFLIQVPLLIIVTAGNVWYRSGAFFFDAPSPFQPLLMAALGLWTAGLGLYRTRAGLGRTSAVLAAAFAATAYLLARSIPSIAAFVSAPPPMFSTASEMQPLFRQYGHWTVQTARTYLGDAVWVVPVLAFLFAREEGRRPWARLVLAWTAVAAALTLWQTRYVQHFSLPAALLMGYGLDRAFSLWGSPAKRTGAALAALVLMFPALKNVAGLPLAPPENLTDSADLLAACDWLRENTPKTRSLWKDEGPPEYGVYSLHTIGDQVAAIAQRPAAAGNMHFLKAPMADSAAFFFMEGSDQAYEFLRRKGFRYVLMSDLVHTGVLPLYARFFGLAGFNARLNPGGSLALSSKLWDLVYMRLYIYDGSFSRFQSKLVAPVDRFRLVYESPTKSHDVREFKVFEVVEGARFAGACAPGRMVGAAVPLRSNQGRAFAYRTFAECEKPGRYSVRVPYAGSYTLTQGGRRKTVEVTDDQVVRGVARTTDFR